MTIPNELLELAERLADAIDIQADARRERAINAAKERRMGIVPEEEVDRWAVAFSTSYQTLRGIAAALRAIAEKGEGK